MKKTMSEYDFINDMKEIRPDNFSYSGLKALYEYFIEYEVGCGIDIEFDPIAFCCEYSEDSIVNILEEYNLESQEELEHNTTVIQVDEENIIIQDY